MIKNVVVVQNPLAPLLNKYFRNPYVHVQMEKEYTENLSRYDVENKWTLPLEVTVRGGKTTGVIGPVFLLLPLALLSLRFPAGRRLLAAAAFVFAPFFLNVGTRFLIPSLPFFSLAICLALGSAPPLLAVLMVFHALASWPSNITRYADKYVWRLSGIPFKEALRLIPQDTVLRRSAAYGVARMLEENVPKGERVLAMNGMAEAYTSRDVLVSFQGAFNESLSDTVNMGWITEHYPTVLRSLKFPSTNHFACAPDANRNRRPGRAVEHPRSAILFQRPGASAQTRMAADGVSVSVGYSARLRQLPRHSMAKLGGGFPRHVRGRELRRARGHRRNPY